MVKQFFFWFFFFISTSTNAAIVDSMFIMGTDYKLLHISNDCRSGYLYAENYQHKKILIYKSNVPYPPNSTFSSDQIESTNILDIGFDCNKYICTRYFNRRTNQLSSIYPRILDYDAKKDVVAYYLRDKNLVVINRAFEICKKPLTSVIKLTNGYEFGSETKFLPTGDLQLGYETATGKYVIKIIHIDFRKLFNDCGGEN